MLKLKHLGIMAALGFMTIGMGAGLAFAGNAIHDNSYSEVEAASTNSSVCSHTFSRDELSKGNHTFSNVVWTSNGVGLGTFSGNGQQISKSGFSLSATKDNFGSSITSIKLGLAKSSKGKGSVYLKDGSKQIGKKITGFKSSVSQVEMLSSPISLTSDLSINIDTTGGVLYLNGFSITFVAGQKEVTSINWVNNLPSMVEVNKPLDLSCKVEAKNGAATTYSVTFDNQDSTLYSYDSATHEFIGLKPCNLEITATATDDTSKLITHNIAVKDKIVPTVNGVTINNAPSKMGIGEVANLEAIVDYVGDVTDKTVTWSAEPSNLVELTQTGEVTAIANGVVTIKATSNFDNSKVGETKISIVKQSTLVKGIDILYSTSNKPESKYKDHTFTQSNFSIKGHNVNTGNSTDKWDHTNIADKSSFETTSAFSEKIGDIRVRATKVPTDAVTVKIYCSTDSTFTAESLIETYESVMTVGENVYKINNPLENGFYKIEFNGTFSKGNVRVSHLDFYSFIPAVLTGLNVELKSNVTLYAGEKPDVNDYVFTALYDDGKTKNVTGTITSPNLYAEGENAIVASYSEDGATVTNETSLKVSALAARKVKEISLSGLDYNGKTFYTHDKWDVTGLIVTAIYDDVNNTKDTIPSTAYTYEFKDSIDGTIISEPKVGLESITLHVSYTDTLGKVFTADMPLNGFTVANSYQKLIWNHPSTSFDTGDSFTLGNSTVDFEKNGTVEKNIEKFDVYVQNTASDIFEKIDVNTFKFEEAHNGKQIYIEYNGVKTQVETLSIALVSKIDIGNDTASVKDDIAKIDSLDGLVSIHGDIGTGQNAPYGKKIAEGQIRFYKGNKVIFDIADGYEFVSATFTYVNDAENSKGFDSTDFSGKNHVVVDLESRGDFSNVKFSIKKVATTAERLDAFVNDFLMMKDNAFKTEEDTGACRNQGLYQNAKDKLLAMEDYRNGTIEEFRGNSKYEAARLRYEAWARANDDFANCYSKVSKSPIMNAISDTTALIVVVAVAVLSVSAISFFVISKKRKLSAK